MCELTARHGRGTVWERHGRGTGAAWAQHFMCESALSQWKIPLNYCKLNQLLSGLYSMLQPMVHNIMTGQKELTYWIYFIGKCDGGSLLNIHRSEWIVLRFWCSGRS